MIFVIGTARAVSQFWSKTRGSILCIGTWPARCCAAGVRTPDTAPPSTLSRSVGPVVQVLGGPPVVVRRHFGWPARCVLDSALLDADAERAGRQVVTRALISLGDTEYLAKNMDPLVSSISAEFAVIDVVDMVARGDEGLRRQIDRARERAAARQAGRR